jgi:ABC-2 type transport system ATP-binding protein
LRKSYGRVVAVESLDLEVAAGTVLGFLGSNGAGKTTAIRMLTTILPPDSGAFTVAGAPHTRPADIRRRVGVLPESAGYPPGHSEWLCYHAELFGRTRADARTTARRLLADVGLEDRGQALISSYSRGMRQRLGIARALVNDPDVVFLDEPTLGLDPIGQLQVLDLIGRIGSRPLPRKRSIAFWKPECRCSGSRWKADGSAMPSSPSRRRFDGYRHQVAGACGAPPVAGRGRAGGP